MIIKKLFKFNWYDPTISELNCLNINVSFYFKRAKVEQIIILTIIIYHFSFKIFNKITAAKLYAKLQICAKFLLECRKYK